MSHVAWQKFSPSLATRINAGFDRKVYEHTDYFIRIGCLKQSNRLSDSVKSCKHTDFMLIPITYHVSHTYTALTNQSD